jgi:saccharopine dehydrogenase-like NADP-dependent oxidoreductase
MSTKKVLVLGAGLSTPSLINYLLEKAEKYDWEIIVGDISKELAEERINGHAKGTAIQFDVFNDDQRAEHVKQANLVVSMLPARLHYLIVKTCLRYKKSMVTASYNAKDAKDYHQRAKENGQIILNEMGLDPGLDHMSAMRIIDLIKEQGGELRSFKSSTGGLVAPRSDNNPWNYKFTWNPRNVVIAGQSGAQYISHGMTKHIPYHKLFSRVSRIKVDGYGEFEVYPNRDSLKYRASYGLEDIPTMFRGTIRRPGFSKTWDILVQLGVTDDSFVVENSEHMTYRDFINTFLKYDKELLVEDKLAKYVGLSEDSIEMYKLRWLGLFERDVIGLKDATPAQILQKRLEEKWGLEQVDRDMIVMQHQFKYKIGGQKKELISSLAVEGKNHQETAMAMTVGLPVGIACKLILTNKINVTGVVIPTLKGIYDPVLKELEDYGIKFIEQELVKEENAR